MLIDHPMVYCAHCGAEQRQSLIIAPPPTATVCLVCRGAVALVGGLWMLRLSELSPEAAGVGLIRAALMQAAPTPRPTGHN
jgi:hypothetical protein